MNTAIENEKKQKSVFNDYEANASFFAFPSNAYHEKIAEALHSIISNEDLQKKFNYHPSNVSIDVYDYINTNVTGKDSQIVDVILIEFLDDKYFDNQNKEKIGKVIIEFIEKFQQIDFKDGTIYSAFEVICSGSNHEALQRDYNSLCTYIVSGLAHHNY